MTLQLLPFPAADYAAWRDQQVERRRRWQFAPLWADGETAAAKARAAVDHLAPAEGLSGTQLHRVLDDDREVGWVWLARHPGDLLVLDADVDAPADELLALLESHARAGDATLLLVDRMAGAPTPTALVAAGAFVPTASNMVLELGTVTAPAAGPGAGGPEAARSEVGDGAAGTAGVDGVDEAAAVDGADGAAVAGAVGVLTGAGATPDAGPAARQPVTRFAGLAGAEAEPDTDPEAEPGQAVVRLVPMTPESFESYLAGAVEEYAHELHDSAGGTFEDALARAHQEYEELLPRGLESDGQLLFDVQDATTGEVAGVLWLGLRPPSAAFVYDVHLRPEHRGRGLGRATMRAAAAWCREAGLDVLGLNVFGHNTVARSLYDSLGYRVVVEEMRLPLPPAPPVTGPR
ncbi:hypothetical protein DNL40_15330 [Xylanimonas oleitrophica]|uniref:N-acetyltransferase domain-containing protein n=1 Tax=Xylanimonas oleitrophica TaxID=2607479 RepID=A0A2W5WLS3_9MICO|nr:GNAT family N-acetyltransferase [Xylanimonas oleitrophica]PZR51643.1 hypothetical protein DNL40_15330 [Xylanimonas oleitrophica]